MFQNFFSELKAGNGNMAFSSRRKDERRVSDSCVAKVNGRTYPVQDWSMGGAKLFADERDFAINQQIEIVMKFKLRGEILITKQNGRIIRKSRNSVGVQFGPVLQQTRQDFQKVIDDHVVGEFAATQI